MTIDDLTWLGWLAILIVAASLIAIIVAGVQLYRETNDERAQDEHGGLDTPTDNVTDIRRGRHVDDTGALMRPHLPRGKYTR